MCTFDMCTLHNETFLARRKSLLSANVALGCCTKQLLKGSWLYLEAWADDLQLFIPLWHEIQFLAAKKLKMKSSAGGLSKCQNSMFTQFAGVPAVGHSLRP